MAEVMIFHYRDDDNFLVHFNPAAKLAALLSYSVIVSSASSSVVFVLALFPIAAAFAIHLPWRQYLKESAFFIVLAAIMCAASYASDHDVAEAAASAVAFLSMVLSSILLMDTTMPDELSRSLGSALSHVIGRRAYALSSLVEITLSMIPRIIDGSVCMFEAMKARGASPLSHPLRFVCQLSVGILSGLLDKAEIYIDALYSRGYDASMRRDCASYGFRDYLMIAISIAAIGAVIAMNILKGVL